MFTLPPQYSVCLTLILAIPGVHATARIPGVQCYVLWLFLLANNWLHWATSCTCLTPIHLLARSLFKYFCSFCFKFSSHWVLSSICVTDISFFKFIIWKCFLPICSFSLINNVFQRWNLIYHFFFFYGSCFWCHL